MNTDQRIDQIPWTTGWDNQWVVLENVKNVKETAILKSGQPQWNTLKKVLAWLPGAELHGFTHRDSNWQHMRPFLPSLRRHMSIVLHAWGGLWKCPTGRFHHHETSWRWLTVWSLCHYTTRKSADLETQNPTPVRIMGFRNLHLWWTRTESKCDSIFKPDDGGQGTLPSPEMQHWNWAGWPSVIRMSCMGATRTGGETKATGSTTSGTGRQ